MSGRPTTEPGPSRKRFGPGPFAVLVVGVRARPLGLVRAWRDRYLLAADRAAARAPRCTGACLHPRRIPVPPSAPRRHWSRCSGLRWRGGGPCRPSWRPAGRWRGWGGSRPRCRERALRGFRSRTPGKVPARGWCWSSRSSRGAGRGRRRRPERRGGGRRRARPGVGRDRTGGGDDPSWRQCRGIGDRALGPAPGCDRADGVAGSACRGGVQPQPGRGHVAGEAGDGEAQVAALEPGAGRGAQGGAGPEVAVLPRPARVGVGDRGEAGRHAGRRRVRDRRHRTLSLAAHARTMARRRLALDRSRRPRRGRA
jgi:hypothetical protein